MTLTVLHSNRTSVIFSPSCTEDTLENIDRDSTGNASDLSIDSTDDEVEVFNLDEAIRHVGPSCPKSKRTVTPITIMICNTIGLKTSRKMLRVLLDSGSMKTLIHKDVVPEGAAIVKLSKSKQCNTLSGSFQVKINAETPPL